MNLIERKKTFIELGNRLLNILDYKSVDNTAQLDRFLAASSNNEWFTDKHIKFALNSIAKNLSEKNLNNWLKRYDINDKSSENVIGVIAAGNIPLVSFHDMLCVLISGNKLIIKLSSKDDKLMREIVNILLNINPEFENLVHFEDAQLKNFDAIIATGSDNTAKYFEYYFGKYHNIIRKNRNSVAVLTGDESEEELEALADDIMMYFGLGCRNVSKLFIPSGFDIQKIFKALYKYKYFADHNKYSNNYSYNKSLCLMNKVPFWENGFAILQENSGIASPIAVIYFEYYNSLQDVKERIDIDIDKIQCVVSNSDIFNNAVKLGQAQKPNLWDYADNVDTMEFLLNINN